MEDLRVSDSVVIPAGELEWKFSPSGGPGGQHANRSATRAELRFDVLRSTAFDGEEAQRIADRLGRRVRDGVVAVVVDESRSQWRNRQQARQRLAHLIRDALRPEPPPRRATRPSRSAREHRLRKKRIRARTKWLRRRPTSGEDS